MPILLVIIAILFLSFSFVVLRGAPYVPSHRRQLQVAFDELHPLSSDDFIIDLGSGDGVVLLEAARRGAGGVGYELNPFLVFASRWRCRKLPNVHFKTMDYTRVKKLPEATTVVYAFTTGHSIEAIGRCLRRWSEGQDLYFISYGFTLKNKEPIKKQGPMNLYYYAKQA